MAPGAPSGARLDLGLEQGRPLPPPPRCCIPSVSAQAPPVPPRGLDSPPAPGWSSFLGLHPVLLAASQVLVAVQAHPLHRLWGADRGPPPHDCPPPLCAGLAPGPRLRRALACSPLLYSHPKENHGKKPIGPKTQGVGDEPERGPAPPRLKSRTVPPPRGAHAGGGGPGTPALPAPSPFHGPFPAPSLFSAGARGPLRSVNTAGRRYTVSVFLCIVENEFYGRVYFIFI